MATIIDSLVVKLGWDEKELETKVPGIKKALSDVEKEGDKTEKSLKRTSKTTKDTSHEFDNLKRSVGGFLALIGGSVAIKAFVSDMIDSAAAVNRLSLNLGLSVSNISAWSNATERFGGSAQGLQGTLDMLSKSQTQLMLTGESSLIPYFSALGVSLADVHGKARPVTDLFLDLNKSINDKMAGGMSRTAANNLLRMMGIDQGSANLILLNRKELELELKRQKEYGDQLAKFAPIAQKFQTALVGIKQKFTLLGLTLLQDAVPVIEKVLGLLEHFASWLITNQETVKDFAVVLGTVAGAFALIGIASSPIALTAAAILGLAAAVALLWQDYQTWKRGGDSLIDWGKWEPGITAASKGIEILRESIVGLYEAARDLKNLLGNNPLIGKALAAASPMLGALGFIGSTVNDGAPNPNARSGGAQGAVSAGLAGAIAKQEGFYASGKTQNRPQRNHNPGNIEDGKFARDNGATGSDGRFAIFPDDQTGMAALTALLHSKDYAGLSVDQAITKYAPPTENDTASYIANVKKTLGGSQNASGYARSIQGVPGASSFAANAPQGPGGQAGSTVDKSIETHIGEINIQTKATDAQGIASDMEHALDYLFVGQANYGLT